MEDIYTTAGFGVEVTICKSGGTDGATVVYIDTAPDDVTADGEPSCRIYLNNHDLHIGTPRTDVGEED